MTVTIVGGGMITNDLILPSIYHLQRLGIVGEIHICALNSAPLKTLLDNPDMQAAFPGQRFTPHPAIDEDPTKAFPDLYKEVLASMPKRNAVVVAMPDPLHYGVVMEALKNDQHVLCVKPLVLKYDQAVEIEQIGREKGLFVGVEYHKRFDVRALMARRHYRLGHFGEFIMGEAKMIEPYFYRFSNFQNWFTTDKTDPFVYVGCHYVDLVCFITGLRPYGVSVSGVKGRFPNGNEGYLWANGRVFFENGAMLSVIDGLGYPDEGAGSNDQCLVMFCEGEGKTGMIKHNDQFRGVSHSYLEGIGCAGSVFNYVSPDFYQLVPWEGAGFRPSGYGYESVANNLRTMHRIENAVVELDAKASLEKRRALIREVDEKGIIATPANSSVNELVTEAARMSILADGDIVNIVYDDHPHVEPRHK
ncbi:MAG TPA: Gfo/Idh/MocA family oxidoreductase [Candidatus Hydrogenedentes bacterium]|nr:Gfo/Idh/MocA family oxidoreductase [Candidatus Hydrogenedentota bacterium]HPG65471.1 Gfo/Idh/MocA family oxidoreductase [Candidatus Hydrogenedentota bacterium]